MSQTIRFWYHWSPLRITEAQMLLFETYFGIVRMVWNHLTTLSNGKRDIVAKQWSPTVWELELLILKMMNQTDHQAMSKMRPGVLRSILVMWLSDWVRWQEGRGLKPSFKQGRQEQLLWLLDQDLVTYQTSKLLFTQEQLSLSLLPPPIGIPPNATAVVIGREAVGNAAPRYWTAALCEQAVERKALSGSLVSQQWADDVSRLSRPLPEGSSQSLRDEQKISLMQCRGNILRRLLKRNSTIDVAPEEPLSINKEST